MCNGSKSNLCSSKTITEIEFNNEKTIASLLEFAACDDLPSFRNAIEEKGVEIDGLGLWYCKRIGSNKMGFEERTPLMVAAMYGSLEVLTYIISTGKSNVNKACGDERVTALHSAVAGCSVTILEVIKILLDASAAPNSVDAYGNLPIDLFLRVSRFVATPRRKAVQFLLSGSTNLMEKDVETIKILTSSKYPADASLPDINEGVYGTDEFRMYSFKVKPCSRAYSHDWTECPFVHPGENARRRDPRKYPYTCVPCPEFRKGSCPKGDSCEYAHGVFESWLHPAQYKTRLCKDETGCARKVCFFAHKREELRPVNASTGSAMVSPLSNTSQSPFSSLEMPVLSPLVYSSAVSTPVSSPMANNGGSLSPRNNGVWQNRVNNITPPPLQLTGSRLKSTLSARDIDMEMELRLSSPLQLQSPSRSSQMKQYPSSPARNQQQNHGFGSSAGMAAVMNANARTSAFAQRSLSFKPVFGGSGNLSDWGSRSGNLDWGMEGEKLRRSFSFGIHGSNKKNVVERPVRDYSDEPDVSWVNSLVKDSDLNEKVRLPVWAEQMYRRDQEQIVV